MPRQSIVQFLYDYDRAGNVTACENVLHSAFDEDYDYDDLDRLENVERADDFDQTWTLDAAGNWSELDDDGSTQTRTVGMANEIEAITGGWVTPEYDAAGNMISGPRAGDGATRLHYKYDAWNRLVEVRDDDSGEPGDLIARYEYDATNRRVEKVVAGGAHVHYYYDGWQIVDEETVDGQEATTARNEYVWSLRYIDAPIVRLHDADGNGNINGVWYYTTDANHNVTAAFNLYTGAVDERYVYTPYGDVTVYSPTWTTPATPTTDAPLFAGYFYDAETSLYQVRHRYYHAELGGFVSRDPIGYAGGINVYGYCGNMPTKAVDPSGLVYDEAVAFSNAWLEGIDDLATGGWGFIRETGYYFRDVGAIGADTVSTLFGHPLYYEEWSQVGQSNRPTENPDFWKNARVNAGRAGLAGLTLGTSEMVGATYEYSQTGDAHTFRHRMAAPITANLGAAAAAKGMGCAYEAALSRSIGNGVQACRSGSAPVRIGGADFYVTADGVAIPGTGFRAIGGPAVAEATGGVIAPRPGGTYFTFDNITQMTGPRVKSLLQMPRTPTHVATFDTIQLTPDISIPKMYWGQGLFPEPIVDVFPQWGGGGGTQAITNTPIIPQQVQPLPTVAPPPPGTSLVPYCGGAR